MAARTVARERKSRIQLSGVRTGKKAIGYRRVSTNDRTQLSLPDQTRIIERIAAAKGYKIVAWYEDQTSRGVRREGLIEALAHAEDDPEIGAILFWHTSRMWGHVEQQRRLMYRAQMQGYSLIDGDGTVWQDKTPLEKLRALLASGVNEYETGTTAERIYKTHVEKFSTGKIIQRPPYGVIPVKTMDADGTVKTEFRIDPVQMSIVRRVFRDYAGGKAAWKIAEELSAENVRTQQNALFTAANIRRMLDNEFYIGVMKWNRTTTLWEIDDITGDKIRTVAYRPEEECMSAPSPLGVILAEDPEDKKSVRAARALFEKCANQRTSRGRERQKRIHDHRVLDGLVICGRCGYRMQARAFAHKIVGEDGVKRKPTKEELKFDYRCQHRTNANKGCSKSHTMTENKIFKLLETLFTGVDSEVVTWQPAQKSAAAHKQLLRRLTVKVEALEKQKARVTQGWAEGVYESIEEFKAERARVQRELDSALAELEGAEDEAIADVAVEMSDELRTLLGEALEQLRDPDIDLEERRATAARYFAKIEVDNPHLTVTYQLPTE